MRRARKTLAALVAACCVAMAIVPAGASAWFFSFPTVPQPNPPGTVPYTGGYGGNPYISPVTTPPNQPTCSPIHHLFGIC